MSSATEDAAAQELETMHPLMVKEVERLVGEDLWSSMTIVEQLEKAKEMKMDAMANMAARSYTGADMPPDQLAAKIDARDFGSDDALANPTSDPKPQFDVKTMMEVLCTPPSDPAAAAAAPPMPFKFATTAADGTKCCPITGKEGDCEMAATGKEGDAVADKSHGQGCVIS